MHPIMKRAVDAELEKMIRSGSKKMLGRVKRRLAAGDAMRVVGSKLWSAGQSMVGNRAVPGRAVDAMMNAGGALYDRGSSAYRGGRKGKVMVDLAEGYLARRVARGKK